MALSWDRLSELFDAALSRPEDERDAFLAEACDDDALRAEVRELLAAHAAEGPMDRLGAAWTPAADMLDAPSRPEVAGRRVGPYRVLRRLGRGGMGEVFLAERADGQFEQEVAVKLLRDGIDDDAARARFLHERQTLAKLEHPGIARLIDGGLTDDGRPFFALEAVQGERIDRYCDSRRLDIGARLRLFGQICLAVHHAHQRLVVHRDLKPSNILVTENGAPHVKLLDFGIAKLLDDVGAEGQTVTRLLTPEYAAPEQVSGGQVSTATDVYALGVVLYELLTGVRPFPLADLAPGEVVRAICETAPLAPSTAVVQATTGDATADTIGADRGTEPATLARRLQGDLDTICLKALDKDPARRYASAEAFLDDVQRHLDGLPVRARPATAGYRLRTFVARHRVSVAAAAVAVLALVGALAGTTWQARAAAAERDRARVEADKAEQSLEFLVTLFEGSDPSVQQGDTLTAREVLARGAAQIDALDGRPEVQATLLDAMGRVYLGLGLFDDAQPLLERALATRQATPDVPPEDVATSLYRLGRLHLGRSDFETAEPLLRQALAVQQDRLGGAHAATATTQFALGELLSTTGRADTAEPLLRHALATRRALFDARHRDVRASTNELALLLHRSGNMAAAETLFAEAVQHGRGLADQPHPAIEENLRDLARMRHRFRFDYAGAEPLYRQALDMARALYGDDHPNVATSHNDLAQLYRDRGDAEAAEPHARAALAIWEARFGPDHPEAAISRTTLASVLQAQGRLAEAERLQRQALATRRARFGDDHISVVTGTLTLGDILYDQGRTDAAEALYRDALDTSRRLYGEEHGLVATGLASLARIRLDAEDLEAAERLYRQALAIRLALHDADHWRIASARSALGGALVEQGRYAEAEALLRPAVARLEAVRGPDDPVTLRAVERLATLERRIADDA